MQQGSVEYYWRSKYDVMETEDKDFLIVKKKSINDPSVRIVATEEYFDILTEIHKTTGHGGRDKIMYSIKDKLYIPKKAIEMFIKFCAVCEMKRSLPRKGIVTKPIISKDFNSRGQVDLIDFQSAADGKYKWLMNYQDHATKFLHLRPLASKKAAEVAFELLKIFLEFGAPLILQSDNGKEFTAHVIEEIVQLWPECQIIHGGPRRPQTQGSVERSNQDVENMLRCWMRDNNSVNWSVGCYFVQYCKNSSFHRIIGRSPYRALFGSDPKTILKGTNIPNSVISAIQTEMDNYNTTSANTNIHKDQVGGSHLNISASIDRVKTPVVEFLEAEIEIHHSLQSNKSTICIPSENENVLSEIESAEDIHVQIDMMPMNTDTHISNGRNASPRSDIISLPHIYLGKQNTDGISTSSSNVEVCLVCGNETTGAHSCRSCCKPMHVICGFSDGKEGYGSQILCFLCKNEQDIAKERELTHKGTKRAAEKMIDQTVKKLPLLEIGNSVFLNVPKLDRGPLDIKNIAGKIVDIRNGVFKVGTTSGTIKNWFPRQDLQISANDYKGVISESLISLRHAVTCQSMFGGQGFQKCSCQPAKNQCRTKRCACYKNKVLCTSKCHQSLSCINK
ncbi:SCAN domain-containing protein 3-like [Choristoneura fumiferana]|uniref:SCAN domain-containing protein 3-like n=1 Tax=Choristoneura fumiferana TaxID=7141 RepID=UPI003D15874B